MKYIIGLALLTVISLTVAAQDNNRKGDSTLTAAKQKNNIFADVCVSYFNRVPGASLTFNHKLSKHFGAGWGLQEYYYVEYYYAVRTANHIAVYQFAPAVYADLRWYKPVNRSLFFAMVDMGMNIYNGAVNTHSTYTHDNGVYTGFGLGYCYRVTDRGSGPYVTVKFITDTYVTEEYRPSSHTEGKYIELNGASAVSVGYKF